MAADEARAERVRVLYEQHKAADPRFTWRKIAEHVGVSERAAHAWGKTGGIDPEHLEKLAEVLESDADYIWRGPREDTPDLLTITARRDQVDDVRDEFRDDVDDIKAQLGALEIRVDKQNELLAEQSGLLARIERERKATAKMIVEVRDLVQVLRGVGAVVSESAANDGKDALAKEPPGGPELLGRKPQARKPTPKHPRAKDAPRQDQQRGAS